MNNLISATGLQVQFRIRFDFRSNFYRVRFLFWLSFLIAPFSIFAKTPTTVSQSMEDLYFRIKAKKAETSFNQVFQNLRDKYGFNGTVLITEKDHVIYKKAFGYADLQTKEPLTTGSVFQLASVSKQFTAVAIMMIKERKVLSYEDPVTRFYPDFPYPEITIRHLLTHRSGLPDYRWFCDPLWPDKDKPLSNQEMMKFFAQHKPAPYFKAGTHHAYSNTGYAVLAAIIEKLSGWSFSDFMQEIVFKPLGMKNTSIYSKCSAADPVGAVSGYERNGSWKAPNDCFNGITGDKNVYSSVEDLYLWDQALYGDRLLKRNTLAEAFMPANPELKGWRNYGFGWRINMSDPSKKIVYHSGWWRGFRTFFLRNTDDHSSIIILSNTVNYSLNSLGDLFTLVSTEDLSE
jgi:CubicO group peptidase (beta-lactamase class C family)